MRRPLIPGLSALAVILVASGTFAAEIRTPPPPAAPRINGPSIYGQRPGRPFLYTIPATGDRPMTFSADGLPEGLQLDPATGRITGKVETPCETQVILAAKNDKGSYSRK